MHAHVNLVGWARLALAGLIYSVASDTALGTSREGLASYNRRMAARWRRRLMEWLIVLVIVAIGVPALAWLMQERLIFFPQPVSSTRHLPARASTLEVIAGDGTHLRGWIVRGDDSPAPTVIYFGGNAEEVSWTLADARWPRAWTIVGLNYRGYGASEGAPGESALTSDALAIYDAVAERSEIDRQRIVVFGRSLGTAVASHLAAQRPVAAVILVSPYDSLTAIGKKHYPWLPVSWLLRHRFDTLDEARRNTMPLLAIVGEADSVIPLERSRALYDAWAGPKAWQVEPGEDHNDLGNSPGFWAGISHFLAKR
ncbi:MAG TPA: alpha/beta hydrolase [Casimicrobiaceae bacterium]|nr:alpha/beta hydrolase [Casimicrobiaceae bacterium]